MIFLYRKFEQLDNRTAYLDNDEIREFREGKADDTGRDDLDVDSYVNSLPYSNQYEIPRKNIFIDESCTLGSGEYGIVIKGEVYLKESKQRAPVAIKMIKKTAEVGHFKALLAELKILAHLGPNLHVVNLCGAWTENIKNRELYVLVELCKTSLLHYLRFNATNFQDQTLLKDSNIVDNSYLNAEFFTTRDIIKWSMEIACGMEFISSKRVIHGDLAARNILFSFDMVPKICDFGLARQVVNYNYVKSHQCPLPWKWMSIESLDLMKFSTMSDVWSFGVTIWEIFSLGSVPYPGLNWTGDFVDRLKAGLRLEKPKFCPEIIYSKMVNCWIEFPENRPTFVQLQSFLGQQLTKTPQCGGIN